jgi:hypothetical protein
MSVRSHHQTNPQRQSDDKQRGKQPGTRRANQRRHGEVMEGSARKSSVPQHPIRQVMMDSHGIPFTYVGCCQPSIGTIYRGRGERRKQDERPEQPQRRSVQA